MECSYRIIILAAFVIFANNSQNNNHHHDKDDQIPKTIQRKKHSSTSFRND